MYYPLVIYSILQVQYAFAGLAEAALSESHGKEEQLAHCICLQGKRKRWMFGLFMDHPPPPREQQLSGTTGTEDKRSHGVVNVEVSSSEANAASVPSTVPRCVACPPEAIRSL